MSNHEAVVDLIREAADERDDALRLVERLTKALKPFSDCVFNDNGDITVAMSNVGYDDFVRAYFATKQVAPQEGK